MGTRNEAGSRAFALLARVIETCRKRLFIASVIAAASRGLPILPLPVISVAV